MALYISGSVKSWMDYRAITNTSTKNYQIAQSATPDAHGFMKESGRYCVALGSYYGDIGDEFRITFEDGQTIRAIKTDGKSDKHTDATRSYCIYDESLVEFLVIPEQLDEEIKLSGDCDARFKGKILRIERRK